MSRPNHLAILGAGPTGLEAALAAAERGFAFSLFEAGPAVGALIRQWGHVRLFSPWDLDVSTRARAALEELGRPAPAGASCPTGHELVERVLQPLADSPAIAPQLRLNTHVVAVSRQGLLKTEAIGDPARAERPFRLLLRDGSGREWTELANVVVDCTGTYGQPNPTGDGGVPAPGEASLESEIVRTIPDVGASPVKWAGRTTLLVGAGHSAQTAVVDLAALAREHENTEIVWAVRRAEPRWEILPHDPLPARAQLARRAQELARGASAAVRCIAGAVVDSLRRRNGRLAVTLRSADGEATELEVDNVLSLTGFVGDAAIYRQLQVHECWATSGPMRLAASLLASSSTDCLDQASHDAEALANPEPNFFILGSKSYGRNSTFLMQIGWQQVDEIFSLLPR